MLPLIRPVSSAKDGEGSSRSARSWRWVLAVCLPLFGAALAWFFTRAYPAARSLIDRLSKDGSMERFTPDVFNRVQLVGLAAGLLLLAAGVGVWVFPGRVQVGIERLISAVAKLARRLRADLSAFGRDLLGLPLDRLDVALLSLTFVGGLLLRILFLSRPMVHDEAYTYVVFAARPWLALISDYHLPNNHIFHSVLVKIATGLLGSQPWAVRFPAFLSGLLCIPAGYWLAKRLYGRWTALLSAALIAVLPVMILYSTNARGYAQYTLFTLLLFALAVYLVSRPNLAGWLIFILIAALGFYTLPMMFYPFGGLMAWLLVSGLFGEGRKAYRSPGRLLKYLILAGLLTGILAALFYLPVIVIGTGWESLAGNGFVARLPVRDFGDTLLARLGELRIEWMMDLPTWLGTLLAVGMALSVLLHQRISRVRVPLQVVMFVWLAVVLVIQRPNPIVRIWTFLIPLCVVWASAGLVAVIESLRLPQKWLPQRWLPQRWLPQRWLPQKWLPQSKAINLGALVAVAGLVYLSGAAIVRAHTVYPDWRESPGRIEQIVQFLQPRVGSADMIAVSSSDAPVLWYYSRQYGIPQPSYDRVEEHLGEFRRAFVVVSQREDQTLPSAILQGGLDPQSFDLAAASIVMDLDGMLVYECLLR